MDEWQTVLSDHFRRYPLMQMEDFIKLTYQSVFGPRHLHAVPDETAIKEYLLAELQEALPPSLELPLVEDIGGGYRRVSLDAVRRGKISIDNLTSAFLQSMTASAVFDERSVCRFKNRIEALLNLIRDGVIPLPFAASRAFVDQFMEQGIRPIHHSGTYRQNYDPQYRVVSADFISDLR